MEIKVKALYEPLDVTVEGPAGEAVTVHAVVDVSGDHVAEVASVCQASASKLAAARLLAGKAEAAKDMRAMRKALDDMGRIAEDALAAAIGAEKVGEIVEAATCGAPLPPGARAELLAPVLSAVQDIVLARTHVLASEKAAHYLSEVADAQPEPDEGD